MTLWAEVPTCICILMMAFPMRVAPKKVQKGTRKWPQVIPARSNRGLGIWNTRTTQTFGANRRDGVCLKPAGTWPKANLQRHTPESQRSPLSAPCAGRPVLVLWQNPERIKTKRKHTLLQSDTTGWSISRLKRFIFDFYDTWLVKYVYPQCNTSGRVSADRWRHYHVYPDWFAAKG